MFSKLLMLLYAIEIKSSTRVDRIEVSKLESLAQDLGKVKIYYLSRDLLPQKIGEVICLSWEKGIKEIFELNKFL